MKSKPEKKVWVLRLSLDDSSTFAFGVTTLWPISCLEAIFSEGVTCLHRQLGWLKGSSV